MRAIDNVAAGDAYTAAATIEALYSGRSMAYLVANNSAYMQVQRRTQLGQGGAEWSNEFLVNPSSGGFTNVIGVRFRNAVAGSVARVIAQIWEESDPSPIGSTVFEGILASSGAVTPGGGVLTGIIPATGTTPTAGTGFTYTHTNGTGIYVFTYTTAFAAQPVVTGTALVVAAALVTVTASSSTGCTIQTRNATTGVVDDHAFNFTVTPIA